MLELIRAGRAWIVGGIAFLALIWIVETSDTFIVETSDTFKDCIHQTKNDKTEHTLYQRISNFPVIFSRRQDCLGVFVHKNEGAITALATLLIAIFTLTLWRATDKMWKASQDQIELSRDEFHASHRPKIKIHVAEFKHTPTEVGEQERAGASVLCFNVGESTAKDVEVRGEIFRGDGFAVDVQRPLIKKVARLESGEKLRFEVMSDWLASEVAAGPRQGRNFYLIGWIVYYDGNRLRRETAYCFRAEFGRAGGPGDRWVSAGKPEYEYAY